MSTISLTLTPSQIQKLKTTFSNELSSSIPPYAAFQIKTEGCVITAYTSNKVVFQGNDAEIYAASFQKKETSYDTHAGSDEVGTGDYFGPVCVCACIVDKSKAAFLKDLGVQDSKALTDAKILSIGKDIMENVKYSLLILEPEKYNKIHVDNNMNAIKAKLHNQAYVNLSKKYNLPKLMVIDQFTPENLYYRYIANEPTIIKGIRFETKAENKYLAVACGSIIARYAFLQKWQEMEAKWNMTFAKGAGDNTNHSLQVFVDKYGKAQLDKVAKIHFKNTELIK